MGCDCTSAEVICVNFQCCCESCYVMSPLSFGQLEAVDSEYRAETASLCSHMHVGSRFTSLLAVEDIRIALI